MDSVYLTWSELKAQIKDKGYLKWLDRETFYLLSYFDGVSKLDSSIEKDSGADHLDFETNYKPHGNKSVGVPKDGDGAPMGRAKVTQAGWTQKNVFIEFTTSVSGAVHSGLCAGGDGHSCVYYYKSVSGAFVLCDDAADVSGNCTRTVVDFEPTHDYEIIGGEARCLERPTSNVRVDCVGVPDVPAAYGGSKQMVIGANMKFFNARSSLKLDGRAAKFLPYHPVYHTNKVRFIIDHDAGHQSEFLVMIETYTE